MRNLRWLVLAVLLPLLSACGGGGSGCSLLGGAVCGGSSGAANVAPVANAGAGQSVLLGTVVTLDASASTDANADVLTYRWTLSKPAGSLATLDNESSAKPVFTADVKGVYWASLSVSDGQLSSTASVSVTVAELNAAPVANAGPDQSVLLNAVVTLDGRDSADANLGDLLTFKWALSKPDGTTALLTGVRPRFTADAKGIYVATLTVSDGLLSSDPVSVRVSVSEANAEPVAVITAAQYVVTGNDVSLSAAGSTDANGDRLAYSWTLLSKPMKASGASADSVATLSDGTVVSPVFKADVSGIYVLSLVVNDGKANSKPVTFAVTASAANVPPVANAGPDQTVKVGSLVTLDATRSTDANGDVLTYSWVLTTNPGAPAVVLASATTANPTFTPTVAGIYVATLTVSDGKGGTHTAMVLIRVE